MKTDVKLDATRFDALLESIAAKQPTPGGGAVASIVGALGAALARMVVNYSIGKKNLAEHDALHREAVQALTDLQRRALELAAADAEAYARLNALWKLPVEDEQRQRDFPPAVQAAIDAPSGILEACLRILDQLHGLAGRTNRMLDSDLAIAAVLAEAGARAAAWNIRINLPLVENGQDAGEINDRMTAALQRVVERTREIELRCTAES
jgi:formiminotetrahydrofolate cyclodeaminase